MNFKLLNLVNSIQVVNKLINSDQLPIKEAYGLSRCIKKIQEELQNFDNFRQELIRKYGFKTESGEYVVKKELEEKFHKEIEALLETDVEIALPKLSLDSLSKVNLSAIEINLIHYMIETDKV